MPEFEPVLLAQVGKPDSHTRAVYEQSGGYATLRSVLKEKSPADVVEVVKTSGLRGRGGAGFPTGLKWTFLPKNHPGPVYFCLNADESEPATFNNRILMEDDPHQVLEGLILSCYATGASRAYFYIRYEYPLAYKRMQAAIDEAYAASYLGENIQGTEYSLDIYMHRGAAAYICGEETGLIESLEGKRAWPRIKPPFPAVEGAFRKPTVVNNVETVACVRHILDRGADWFRSIGVPPDPDNPRDAGSFGPKLYCMSGHINKPRLLRSAAGPHGSRADREPGWRRMEESQGEGCVVPGGISMGLLTAEELDCPLDFNGPGKYQCLGLGTAAVVVIDETVPMVDFLYNTSRFLLARELRPVYSLPRRDFLGLQDDAPDQGGQGAAEGFGPAARDRRHDRHHAGHDDLWFGRWRRLAAQERAIRKFRDEFEEYIKKSNPEGYDVTEPVPALPMVQLH